MNATDSAVGPVSDSKLGVGLRAGNPAQTHFVSTIECPLPKARLG